MMWNDTELWDRLIEQYEARVIEYLYGDGSRRPADVVTSDAKLHVLDRSGPFRVNPLTDEHPINRETVSIRNLPVSPAPITWKWNPLAFGIGG